MLLLFWHTTLVFCNTTPVLYSLLFFLYSVCGPDVVLCSCHIVGPYTNFERLGLSRHVPGYDRSCFSARPSGSKTIYCTVIPSSLNHQSLQPLQSSLTGLRKFKLQSHCHLRPRPRILCTCSCTVICLLIWSATLFPASPIDLQSIVYTSNINLSTLIVQHQSETQSLSIMAMDNSKSFNAPTQAHPGRSAADYRTLQTLLTTAVTSIPKKPYLKGTSRKLDQTERKFRDFCINTLGMVDVRYSTDAVIPYLQSLYDNNKH